MNAILISNAFVEIKGTVFKKWDVNRLEKMTIQDVVEQYTITTCIMFILLENMLHVQSWVPSLSALKWCSLILVSEVVIDMLKHSFLAKVERREKKRERERERERLEGERVRGLGLGLGLEG